MAEEGVKGQGFAERRAAARARAGELQARFERTGDPAGWFDALYRAAEGDAAQVPWADLEPHPLLSRWLERYSGRHAGRALDIGSGLGDNAMALARAGYEVTAFDVSPAAVAWAKRRFEGGPVRFLAADLLALSEEFLGAFDLVHETYTVQALKGTMREAAFAAIARTLAPGGRLLVVCRSRGDDEVPQGPPWPLSRAELAAFDALGLASESFETITVEEERAIPHFVATWLRRP